MTEQVNNPILPSFTEAPASLNFFGITSKGWNIQITLRDEDETHLLERFAVLVDELGNKYHVTPKPVGAQPQASTPATTTTSPPPENGSHGQSVCAMIEVGTAFKSGNTQLKFHCDGMEHPITFTKAVGEMAKLLAPLNIPAEQIVVGKKFSVNATVSWEQVDKYKNVLAVTPR